MAEPAPRYVEPALYIVPVQTEVPLLLPSSFPETAKGALIPIGGKASDENLQIVARHMVDGTGLTIISTPADGPDVEDVFNGYKKRFEDIFDELGKKGEIFHLHAQSSYREGIVSLEDATVYFITGGRQARGLSGLHENGFDRVLREEHQKQRKSVAGTSAGASLLSKRMPDGAIFLEGIGLAEGVIFDQHFQRTGRFDRLAAAVAETGDIGFGLFEGGGIIYEQNQARVIGNGLRILYPTSEGVVSRTLHKDTTIIIPALRTGDYNAAFPQAA